MLDLLETNIVFRLTTGRSFAWNELGLAILVIIPFAVITELVIDHPKFWVRVLHLREVKEAEKAVEKAIT